MVNREPLVFNAEVAEVEFFNAEVAEEAEDNRKCRAGDMKRRNGRRRILSIAFSATSATSAFKTPLR